MNELDLTFVDSAVERIGRDGSACIPLLQAVQDAYGWLPPEAMSRVCERTEITPAQIAGVSTFYDQFRHRPVGEHVVRVCVGTACHVKGAGAVYDALLRHLKVPAGDDTDPAGVFTVQKVACLGCCTLAPVVQIGSVTYGHMAPDRVGQMLRDYLANAEAAAPDDPAPLHQGPGRTPPPEIRLGLGSCCVARGSAKVQSAVTAALAATGAPAVLKQVGCVGMCHQTPLLEIVERGADGSEQSHLYAQVDPDDAAAILRRHLRPPHPLRRAALAASRLLDRLLDDSAAGPVDRYAIDTRDAPVHAFLSGQRHVATEHCGVISPVDLDEYLSRGGFAALREAVARGAPEALIDTIERSGLRGRGGAGFPTGRKWRTVRDAPGDVKYVVCNGDEGDPGAFMDRMLLESYPYRVLEGVMLAAHAVGAATAYLYIRAEYPLALARIRIALDRLRERGILCDPSRGTITKPPDCVGGMRSEGSLVPFPLDIRIMEGAGAFVCGEETALLESIEGRRGMPRFRPPYPAHRGLWNAPTLVNNTETLAMVPWIVRNGAEAFAAMGTGASAGAKVFALAGKVARGGLIEVPMGISLRRIVEEIGGGIAGGKRLKAVQVGGPSGGCVPAALCDTPVDYEALTSVGAIMGSGGLVVLDEDDCMVEIARYFLEFTQDQSCGKCTFCRVGTRRMLEILERLCGGTGRRGDLEELEHLGRMVQRGSLCGLGRTAPNPVLSTLRYFRDEYEAHLEGRCPAKKCVALIDYAIDDDCIGCTLCAQHCPTGAIELRPHERHEIDMGKCIRCDTCRAVCPVECIHRRDRGERRGEESGEAEREKGGPT